MVSRTDDETMRILDDVDHPVRARESGRQRSRRRLVHAQRRIRSSASLERPAAALPEVHRPRQQPRLLRLDAGGDREHQPRALPRVVPADSLQPPSERAGRARSSSRRRCAIRSTTTWIRCSCSASSTLGTAMHTRLAAEGKPGATMRSGGPYDGWWNGGIRNTAAFHNTIAILTEMIGSPTPMRIPLVAAIASCRRATSRIPIAPQEWHFRQSIDYSVSLQPRGARLSRRACARTCCSTST